MKREDIVKLLKECGIDEKIANTILESVDQYQDTLTKEHEALKAELTKTTEDLVEHVNKEKDKAITEAREEIKLEYNGKKRELASRVSRFLATNSADILESVAAQMPKSTEEKSEDKMDIEALAAKIKEAIVPVLESKKDPKAETLMEEVKVKDKEIAGLKNQLGKAISLSNRYKNAAIEATKQLKSMEAANLNESVTGTAPSDAVLIENVDASPTATEAKNTTTPIASDKNTSIAPDVQKVLSID